MMMMMNLGTYFAVQQAMTLGAKEPDSQTFLLGIMDKLEAVSPTHSVSSPLPQSLLTP